MPNKSLVRTQRAAPHSSNFKCNRYLYKEGILNFNPTFKAILNEAQFTNEMLGAGATQIRKANYAQKGIYFQAFTSLSTGLERLGKLCVMLDYYIDNNCKFPDIKYLKNTIGHDILALYNKASEIIEKHSITLHFLENLDDKIHQNILRILSGFALGDRYTNIDILVNSQRNKDPINQWFNLVDKPLYNSRVSNQKKQRINQNAEVVGELTTPFSSILYISENGESITQAREASLQTGIQQAVAPYRQLYVLQIIRFWVDLINGLHYETMKFQNEDVPYLSEVFPIFYNDDNYFKSRKTWDKI